MVFFMCGCGGGTSHESVMKETVSLMNEMASIMENSANAEAAKPKLEQLSSRFKELKKKADALPKTTETQDKELKKKFEPEIEAAMKKFFGAMMTLTKKDPNGIGSLQSVLKGFDLK